MRMFIIGVNGTCNPVKTSLQFFRSLFPVEKFEHRLPPIIMKTQLYSLCSNRASVDKHIVSSSELCHEKMKYRNDPKFSDR